MHKCSIWQDIERQQVIGTHDLSVLTMLDLLGWDPQLSLSTSSLSGALLAEHLLHQFFPLQALGHAPYLGGYPLVGHHGSCQR